VGSAESTPISNRSGRSNVPDEARAIPIDPSEFCASPMPGSWEPQDRSGFEERRAETRPALTSPSPILVRSVVLAGAFDMTAAEISRCEHMPLGTAKSRIRAAKQLLRGQLIFCGESTVLGDLKVVLTHVFRPSRQRFLTSPVTFNFDPTLALLGMPS
jgi:hypothetical protein